MCAEYWSIVVCLSPTCICLSLCHGPGPGPTVSNSSTSAVLAVAQMFPIESHITSNAKTLLCSQHVHSLIDTKQRRFHVLGIICLYICILFISAGPGGRGRPPRLGPPSPPPWGPGQGRGGRLRGDIFIYTGKKKGMGGKAPAF